MSEGTAMRLAGASGEGAVKGAAGAEEMVLRLGELFCGPGGLALGAVRSSAGDGNKAYHIGHAWASDYHEDTCATYANNICRGRAETVYCEDVHSLDLKKLGPIDIFAYGFPCNDFSIVGESKGIQGKFGPLYTYGVKILDLYKPRCFVAENVGGISSANEGLAFKRILEELKSAGNGYVLTVHYFKFEEYGVPQRRHRYVIVGIDKSLGLKFSVPAPTHASRPKSASEALENPPIPPSAPNHEATAHPSDVVERLKRIQPGQNAWTADLPPHLRLNVKNTKMSLIYRRLRPDEPATTIVACGGGGTHSYHYSEPRALTNRERARLQTFTDDFRFVGTKGSVRRQIGMAVPPAASEVIFTALLKTLAGIKYDSVPSTYEFQDAQKDGPQKLLFPAVAGGEDDLSRPIPDKVLRLFRISREGLSECIAGVRDLAGVSADEAALIVEKAISGGEITPAVSPRIWLRDRWKPNCVAIDESGYARMCIDALRILSSAAGTDHGTSRQRDIGQMWADMTRGYLGELAFSLLLEKRWGVKALLDHKAGPIEDYLSMDIHQVQKPGEAVRKPRLKIGVKTTKWNGIWLDIPGQQHKKSDIHVFVKIGAGRDHLLSFFKAISVFKDKVLKRGVEVGALDEKEAGTLFDKLPSFRPISAYVCGFARSKDRRRALSYGGRKGRINYTIESWNGPIHSGDLDKIREREGISGKAVFEGIGEFAHDSGHLFNAGRLLWSQQDWESVIKAL